MVAWKQSSSMKNHIATENVSWQNTVGKLAKDAEIATRQYGFMPQRYLTCDITTYIGKTGVTLVQNMRNKSIPSPL